MIYFIGGTPRVGKSIIAQEISDKVGGTVISTDKLRDAVFKTTNSKMRPLLFPYQGFSGDASENIISPVQRLHSQIIEANSLHSLINELVIQGLKEQKTLVFEGVHLFPEYIQPFVQTHNNQADRVDAIFLGSRDKTVVLTNIEKDASPNNWLKEADKELQVQVAEFVVACSNYVYNETGKYKLTYIERTNNFETDQDYIFKCLGFKKEERSGKIKT